MKDWLSPVRSLVAVRARSRSSAYLLIICIESLIAIWGFSEGGVQAAAKSLVVIVLLIIQSRWPTLLVWVGLLGFYGADVLRGLVVAHVLDDYIWGVTLYLIPVAALLWARPWRPRDHESLLTSGDTNSDVKG